MKTGEKVSDKKKFNQSNKNDEFNQHFHQNVLFHTREMWLHYLNKNSGSHIRKDRVNTCVKVKKEGKHRTNEGVILDMCCVNICLGIISHVI